MNAFDWYADGQTKNVLNLPIFFRRGGHGQTLVCIHGFPSSSWDFEILWPQLTNRFELIAHDLVGLGKSAKPDRKLTVSLQADVIEELLLSENIPSAHILAHDLGDTVAQELLARQSAGSSKIQWLSCVFLNGGIFPETHKPLLIQKLLLSPFGPILAKLTSEKSLHKSFHNIFSEAHPPSDEFIHQTWELICHDNGKAMIPKLIQYMNERKVSRERWVKPLVDKIVPIRLINGVEDPISGTHAADRFAEVIPDADIVHLDNSGHYPHVETPEEVLNAFVEFHDNIQ